MRILHTADWHAGKPLERRSRLDELRAVLAEIVAIAEREAIDVVLMTGDVFDQKSPAADAEEVVYQALLDLERRAIHVVILAGNHDNPLRWRALRPLLRRFHVHVVSEVTRPDQGGIVEIAVPGRPVLQVATLPWVPLRRVVTAATMMAPDLGTHARYADGVGALMQALCRGLRPDACTVFAGHMTIDGAKAGGGERVLTLGNVYGVDAQAFPQVQYVALGHIHRPQKVGGGAIPARYCGSPMQLDFGETGYTTSVTLVDLEPGLPAQVREVPITTARRLLDVGGTLDELAAQRDALGDAFLRVTLRCAKPVPGLGEQVREVLPHALQVRLDYPRQEAEARGASVRAMSAGEQFGRYLREKHGADADPTDLALFEALMDEVTGGGEG